MLQGCWISRALRVLVAGMVLAGCQPAERLPPAVQAHADDPVIATFTGGEVRRSDIAGSLERRAARAGNSPQVRREQVKILAQRQARTAQLHQRALASGIAQRGDVLQRLAARRDLAVARDWLDRDVLARVNVSDAEVDAELMRRRASAARPETRSFSHIFLRAKDPASFERAERLADEIRERAEAGESFAALAQQYSDSITSRAGGVVRLVRQDTLSADLGKLIFGLTEGTVSEAVTNKDGVHLFRVDAVVPASPADLTALRGVIADELRTRAREAAVDAVRRAALAEAGLDFPVLAERLDAKCAALEPAVFTLNGQTFTCEGLAVLRRRWPDLHLLDTAAVLKYLAFHRILAQRAVPAADSALARERLLRSAERNELIAAYRDELMDVVDVSVSAEQLGAAYRELGDTAPELQEWVADLLFFEQSGDDVAGLYSRGEQVLAQLRAGGEFPAIMQRLQSEPGVRVWRGLEGMTQAELGKDQPALRNELLRLAPGELSVPLLIGGNPVRVAGKPVIAGNGLLFVHKIQARRLSQEAARDFLTRTLLDARRLAAQKRIYEELDRAADLRIVLPEG